MGVTYRSGQPRGGLSIGTGCIFLGIGYTRRADSLSSFTARTQKEVAEFFGKSAATVALWAREGMPGRRGEWDLSAIQRWLEGRREETKSEGEGPRSPELERKRKWDADRAEMEVREKRGELISRPEAERIWAARILAMKRQIRTQGKRLAASLEGLDLAERLQVLETDNDKMLAEFARGHVGIEPALLDRLFELLELPELLREEEGEGTDD